MAVHSPKVPALLFATAFAIVLGSLTAYLIRGTSGVHIPLLAAVTSGILIGFTDSRKGWIAALVQSAVLAVGVLWIAREGPVPEIEYHSYAGAVGLTFVGSFIGAFIKRAFDS